MAYRDSNRQNAEPSSLKVSEDLRRDYNKAFDSVQNLLPSVPQIDPSNDDIEVFLKQSLQRTFQLHEQAVAAKIQWFRDITEQERARLQKKKEKMSQLKKDIANLQKMHSDKSTNLEELQKKAYELEKKVSSKDIQAGLLFHKLKSAKGEMEAKDSKLEELLKHTMGEITTEEALRISNERVLLLEEKGRIADQLIVQLMAKQNEEGIGIGALGMFSGSSRNIAGAGEGNRSLGNVSTGGNIKTTDGTDGSGKPVKSEEELDRIFKETRLNRIRNINLSTAVPAGATSLVLTKEQIDAFSSALSLNTTIQSLDLSYVNFGDSILQVVQALKGKQNIKSLSLEGCGLSEKSCKEVLNTIGFTGVTTLNLNNNLLNKTDGTTSNDWARSLSQFLKRNTSILHLSIGGNMLGANGMREIALDGLAVNNTAVTIDLSGNNVGSEGAQHLAACLTKNKTLQSINLWGNMIGSAGIKAIAEALKSNRTLKEINLRGNNLRDEGAKYLAALFETSSLPLKMLDISGNSIGIDGMRAITGILMTRPLANLAHIYVGGNNLGDEGAAIFAQILKSHRALESVHLELNLIADSGARAIAAVLKELPSLATLDLSFNRIGMEGAKVLKHSITKNLKQVLFQGNALLQVTNLAISDLESIEEVRLEPSKLNSGTPKHERMIKKTQSFNQLLSANSITNEPNL